MLIKTYQVPDVLTYTILFHSSSSLERTCYYPLFADEKRKRWRDLSNIKPLISARVGLQDHCLQPYLPSSCHHVVQLHVGHAVEEPPLYHQGP